MTKISLYLARQYLFNFISFMLIILAIIFVFDVLEILRRLDDNDASILTVMAMGLLKLPEVGQLVLPFGILFSAMFTFWQLNRRQELVVLRSSGLSVWQFLFPILGVAVFLGLFQIFIINPVGAVLLSHYESYEQRYLSHNDTLVTSLDDGLWLRQSQNGNEMIIHSTRIDPKDWTFYNVTIYEFDADYRFTARIDGPKAKLTADGWYFSEGIIHTQRQQAEPLSDYVLPTSVSPKDIENSFSSPESRSFWELPGLVHQLHNAGFDTTRLRIHFHSLLSVPLLFAAMVSVAAVLSLKPTMRSGGTLRMVLAGIFIGFVIFFMTNFLKALGASNQMPILIAAWSPAIITFFAGLGILLNTEDG